MNPSAQIAISILKELLEQTSPDVLAFWVTPNTILTLSGARAYCDGVFYDDESSVLNSWADELTRSIKVLQSITDVYFAEAKVDKTNAGEPYASYDLIFMDGLKNVLRSTKLIANDEQFYIKQLTGEKLVSELAGKLKQLPDTHNYNDENLRHVAFGILVGYPDKAILCSVGEWDKNDPFGEPLIDADIRGAGFYLCPQPIYSYPRHLVNDKDILVNEQLWSRILKDFYTSDFHEGLSSNAGFKRKAKRLGLFP